ncbi:MAG: ABC transporter ATP-binding protein [Lachnospiraceae bacterium]|nr:ABC transporter ATP-binding protein [Lachnospiraceae bacterium]
MIKKILSYLGEYKKYAILTPAVMVGEVLMEVLIPFVMAAIIDNGIQGSGGVPYTVRLGLIMICMALCSLFFGALGGKFAAKAGMGFAKNIRKALFDKVQDFSFANVDRFSTASLVTRLTTDVTNTQNAFMMMIRMGVRAPFMLIGAVIMALTISPELSTVFLVAIPILAVSLVIIINIAFPRFQEMLRKYDSMNGSVQENLVNIRVVKAFVREDHEKEKFDSAANFVRKAQVAAEKIIILNMPIMQLTMYGSIVAILWFGGNMVIGGTFAIGELSSFISYVTQILMSLMMLSMIFIMIVISRASVTRIVEVLDEDIDIKDEEKDATLQVPNGDITFKDVCFSYAKKDDNLTLEHINLEIYSGETIGIIGGTGSAKTSLVQLIPRLYDVQSGEVLVGDHNVKDYSIRNLREEVAMVLQKNVLFSGTIKDNLKWGNEEATDEEIIEMCKAAQADEFIQSFPDGYDTDLGQGGVNVSGGQKQRICIARALLKKPKIIILDDSTSAVDTATDSKIRQAFREKLNDTTTIIIAQRISSVQDADRIIVIDDGKINAFDTHENLLKNNEIYREVYESQQKGDE